jgi:hypothetical protein
LEDVPTDDDLGYLGFTSLHVPGGGGVRSFHVTLTDRYAMEDGSPVPLSFSSSLVEESECARVYEVVERTEELEIVEGDGVLGGCWILTGVFLYSCLILLFSVSCTEK